MNDPMTDAERAELRRLTEAAKSERWAGVTPAPEDWSFIWACSPAAVLALLDDRDRLAAEVARLRAELEDIEVLSVKGGMSRDTLRAIGKIAAAALEPK